MPLSLPTAGDDEVWVAMAPPENPDGAGAAEGEGGIVRVDVTTGTAHAARLFLSSDTHLTVVDVDQAEVDTRPVAALAPGDPPYRLVARDDALVFYGREGTYRLDATADQPPTLLGSSEFFVPSAVEDRVWLVEAGSGGQLREVDVDGNETVPAALAPAGWPAAAVADGVVLETAEGGTAPDGRPLSVLRDGIQVIRALPFSTLLGA